MDTTWCYICELTVPRSEIIEHAAMHCDMGEHCTAQAPECAVDTGPGRDHERPFRCCDCGRRIMEDGSEEA